MLREVVELLGKQKEESLTLRKFDGVERMFIAVGNRAIVYEPRRSRSRHCLLMRDFLRIAADAVSDIEIAKDFVIIADNNNQSERFSFTPTLNAAWIEASAFENGKDYTQEELVALVRTTFKGVAPPELRTQAQDLKWTSTASGQIEHDSVAMGKSVAVQTHGGGRILESFTCKLYPFQYDETPNISAVFGDVLEIEVFVTAIIGRQRIRLQAPGMADARLTYLRRLGDFLTARFPGAENVFVGNAVIHGEMEWIEADRVDFGSDSFGG